MTKREEEFCFDLSKFMCYPLSFEIGGASEYLKDIIINITKKNDSIRKRVFEYCESFVENGRYNANAYESSDNEEVLKMIKEDYNRVLFSERNGYDNTFKDRRESYIKGYDQAMQDFLEKAEDKNTKIKRRIKGYLDEINQQSIAHYCTKQQLKDILNDILECCN